MTIINVYETIRHFQNKQKLTKSKGKINKHKIIFKNLTVLVMDKVVDK